MAQDPAVESPLGPARLWPTWLPPAEPDFYSDVRDGYGNIARFASPACLRGHHGLAPVAEGVRVDANDPHDWQRRVAERLYDHLRDCHIPYDRAPWEPGAGQSQRLRDPGWVLGEGGSGTCIDLALLYAAMCLQDGLLPYLVLLRGPTSAHALVAVDLTRSRGEVDAEPFIAGVRWQTKHRGVGRLDVRQAVKVNDEILLVECTCATGEDPAGFAEACVAGAERVIDEASLYDHVHFVNVPWRQDAEGDLPLEPPAGRGVLRHPLPTPTSEHDDYRRQEAEKRLRDHSGVIILYGDQGTGKSYLARQIAAGFDAGIGWFLPATSEKALIASLAEHELFERGAPARDLDAEDRVAYARAARARLNDASGPWVVVIDNADRGFDSIVGWLPETKLDQKLIVTTTNRSWINWAKRQGRTVEVLERVSDDVVDDYLADPALVKLAAGRPLLLRAFRKVLSLSLASEQELAQLSAAEPDVTDDLAGPRVLWRFAKTRCSEEACDAARLVAWLPPDRTTAHVLAAAFTSRADETNAALEELEAVGLVQRPGNLATMHRLFGKVIRDDQARDGRAQAAAAILLEVRETSALLAREGDADTTDALRTALGAEANGLERQRFARVLCTLGAIEEFYLGTKVSGETFDLAAQFLDDKDAEDLAFIAECLHGRARDVNQNHSRDDERVLQAIDWTKEAIAMRDPRQDVAAVAKHQALLGLLKQRYAEHAIKDQTERLRALHEVKDILEDSWKRRLAELGDEDPLVDRGLFNRAGIRIQLAQSELDLAEKLLDEAKGVYEQTLRFRRHYYQEPHPLIAASIVGLATVFYYQALLDSHAREDGRASEELLNQATNLAYDGLLMRRRLDGGRDEKTDTLKTLRLLSKITRARWERWANRKDYDEYVADIREEMAWLREMGHGE